MKGRLFYILELMVKFKKSEDLIGETINNLTVINVIESEEEKGTLFTVKLPIKN